MSNVPPYDPFGQPQGGGYNPPPPPPGGSYNPPPPPPPPPGGGYNPPPPGGYNPPPPPPPGGYGQPPGGYGQPPGGYGAMPPPSGPYTAPGYGEATGTLAEWPARAWGWVVDWGVFVVLDILTFAAPAALRGIIGLLALAWGIFTAIQLGTVGTTPGMRLAGLRCVSKKTGQPIGAGMGVLRWILHILDSLACLIIGWVILPLVTKEKQTIADMILGTVVVTAPKQGFSFSPPK
ncbi:MAG: RDD family protein [Acidimicrobiales bacterium]